MRGVLTFVRYCNYIPSLFVFKNFHFDPNSETYSTIEHGNESHMEDSEIQTGWASSSVDGEVEHHPQISKIAQRAAKTAQHSTSNAKVMGSNPWPCMN